jgi:hypothetical protein
MLGRPTFEEMLMDIRNEKADLCFYNVSYFTEIVNQQFPNFSMQPPQYYQNHRFYKPAPIDKDDLQIIFGSMHFVVAYSPAGSNTVFVYDSLLKRITPDQKKALMKLYPKKKYKHMKPATMQPDYLSCGVFAIANTTSILFGHDPSTYALALNNNSTMELRSHLLNIYQTRQIVLFPRANI